MGGVRVRGRQTGVRSSAYGLGVWCNVPIPGLPSSPGVGGIDVRVRLGAMPPLTQAAGEALPHLVHASPGPDPVLRVWRLAGGRYFQLQYRDGTRFLIDRAGGRVWGTWPEPWTIEDTAAYLLGPVFGFLLRLRGSVCLHASAVAVEGRVAALLGPSGAGKSTTAAAFARLGFAVLSDDIVPVEPQGGGFVARPGNPRLRLWPESVRTLFGAPDALPRFSPNWDKRYLDLSQMGMRFEPRLLPLGAVYLLGERRQGEVATSVGAITSREALVGLVANTYANNLLDAAMRAHEFALLGRLVAGVPVRRVTPHADPARLPDLCRVILDDFRRH